MQVGTVSITEVGMALWDTDLHAPIKLAGYLVDPGPDAIWEKVTPEMRALGLLPAAEVSGITPELCAKYGVPDLTGLKQLLSWYRIADAVVAHNGHEFDYPLLERWAKKHGLELPDKLRIDTMCDIELPPKTIKKLIYMAADHGFLNPFPHRALFDVMTMMRIMNEYDLNEILETAKSPTLVVEALVTFAQKDLAKTRGFHAQYENGRFQMWSLVVKERYLERERAAAQAAGFEIKVVSKK